MGTEAKIWGGKKDKGFTSDFGKAGRNVSRSGRGYKKGGNQVCWLPRANLKV
jgi:hypothetical protein